MSVVFGGLNGFFDDTIVLDSSEVFSSAGVWYYGANLPQPMYGLRATNIDSRVLIFGIESFGNSNASWICLMIVGGSYFVHYYDTILEYIQYNVEEDAIVTVGQMLEARDHHAISVVKAEDFSQWCE